MTNRERTPAEETAAAAREAVERLTARGLRLATAESTVGGLIGHALTDVPGASRVFPGGITAYANPPKQALLGVPAAVLEEYGSVSPETALAMAQGAGAAFGADLALAETGIASALPPERATPERPPGLYFIALVARDYAHVARRIFPGLFHGHNLLIAYFFIRPAQRRPAWIVVLWYANLIQMRQ